MELRAMGKTGVKLSPLGFGVMRLPLKNGGIAANNTTIDDVDVDTSIEMIHQAIDAGVNYFDTAYNYVNGSSEVILGKALAGDWREKVYVASKSPAWLYKEPADFDKYLDIQLGRLDMDYLDFYLLHSLNGGSWKKSVRNGAVESMQRAKAAGKVRYIGFSFHDDLELFKEILDAAPWDFCQIQLNYYD
ncbi:MAG: aldo/keto reductase, partial [Eggerthellaceae bacterium]